MPSRRGRILALAAAALLLAARPAGSVAPSPDPDAAAKDVTRISVWTHSADGTREFQALQAAVDSFNRSQRKYRVEAFPSMNRNYEDRVFSAAATGTLPCVVEMDGPFLYVFAWPGYLRPIDDFVTPKLLADFLPSVIAQGTYEGRLYSLAQFDSGLALWGNRRHLRAAGVRIPTLERPWSLAEFEDALEKLAGVKGVAYPLSLNMHIRTNEFYSYAYAPILQGFGGDLVERGHRHTARGVLDGAASVAAMKRLQLWFERGWTRAVFDRDDDFEKGRAALSWIGHWRYVPFRKALGDDLVLLPLPDFGRGIKTGMGSWNWGISSTCPAPKGAWKFLEHLLSPEEILRMTAINGAVPARRSAFARSPLYGQDGPLRIFARQLETGAGVPRPATPGYSTIRLVFSAAVTAIMKGSDVEAELGSAAAAIDEDVAKHGGYSFQ